MLGEGGKICLEMEGEEGLLLTWRDEVRGRVCVGGLEGGRVLLRMCAGGRGMSAHSSMSPGD